MYCRLYCVAAQPGHRQACHCRNAFSLWRGGYQGTHPQSGKLEEARNWGNFGRGDCLCGSGNLPADQSTRAVAAFELGTLQISWAKTLDCRPNEPTSFDLNDAELEELKSRLASLDIGRQDDDLAGFTPYYSISIQASGYYFSVQGLTWMETILHSIIRGNTTGSMTVNSANICARSAREGQGLCCGGIACGSGVVRLLQQRRNAVGWPP